MTGIDDKSPLVNAEQVAELLGQIGVVATPGALQLTAVNGGVSAEVWHVLHGEHQWCVKRPRSRLQVDGLWEASPRRVDNEIAWLRAAARLQPELAPPVLARHPVEPMFLMPWYDPRQWLVWKSLLLEGQADTQVARTLGTALGRLQARAAATPELAHEFADSSHFEVLRLVPFFDVTAAAHPDLAPRIAELRAACLDGANTLVHGDVSPKNVLLGPGGRLLLLDAECAVWGDAAFDGAFLLSHLLLKGAHDAQFAHQCMPLTVSFMTGWSQGLGGSPTELRRRALSLVPLLLLARVDGLSPVDYLSTARAARVRSFARTQLRQHAVELPQLAKRWERAMQPEAA